MKFFVLFAVALAMASAVIAHEVRIFNHCPFTLWPGILNNPGKSLPFNGGFKLNAYQTQTFTVPDGWAGRFWARTNCIEATGHCETGDCGNKIECAGAGGVPPISWTEIIFDGLQGQDSYHVSLIDGYNIPIRIEPLQGTFKKVNSGFKYDCNPAGCNANLNAHCPEELAVKNGGGSIVACKSPCMQFNTDEYCCRGAHNQPQTCEANTWPKNYSAIFKQSCPDAYSYAYDVTTSRFICHGNPKTGYLITLCP